MTGSQLEMWGIINRTYNSNKIHSFYFIILPSYNGCMGTTLGPGYNDRADYKWR